MAAGFARKIMAVPQSGGCSPPPWLRLARSIYEPRTPMIGIIVASVYDAAHRA